MMKNYDQSVEINHNPNWPYIPDHPYRILIIGGTRSGKTNALLNLIKHQRLDIGKSYLYVKDKFESNYQLLINGREKVGIKKLNVLIDYSETRDDVNENLEDYGPTKKGKVLIVFDDMIADMGANKKLIHIVTELFFRSRNLKISLVFTSQSYFKVCDYKL